jgi:hypothetical protein
MEKHELAEELRKRQLEKAEEFVRSINEGSSDKISVQQFKDAVNSCSEDEIIMSYLICSGCGAPILSYETDVSVMTIASKSIEEWFGKIDEAIAEHTNGHQGGQEGVDRV